MFVLSLFLWVVCFVMFSGVGCVMRRWYSLCCFFISFFIFGSHQGFLGRLGIISCVSMICLIVCCILSKCCPVLVSGGLVRRLFVIAVLISLMIVVFNRSYRPRDSVLCLLLFCCRGGGVWIIA